MKKGIVLLSFLVCLLSFGQYTSPFNKKEVNIATHQDYSFLVSGHFYGGRYNDTHYPINTLLANLDWINDSKANMLVCLGDLFKDIKRDRLNYQTSFFDKLKIPLLNTVGNHDLTETVYQDNFGQTAFYFQLGNDVHLVLDSERDNGDFEDDQLQLLKDIQLKIIPDGIENVFVYMHRTVWKSSYSEMDGIFEDNTQSITGSNYGKAVFPLLQKIGKNANVHLFSGSLGPAPASFFHHYDKENNIRIIATAIRGLPRDAVLQVFVKQGKVSFKLKSFTGQDLMLLEDYNVELWQNEIGEAPFNWRLVPYYIELMLTHRYFWFGALFCLGGIFSTKFTLKWWSKRKKTTTI